MTLRERLGELWGTLMNQPRRIRLEREDPPEKLAFDATVVESAAARETAKNAIDRAHEHRIWIEEALTPAPRPAPDRRERGAYS